MTDEYTPGYTKTASDFMAQRTAQSHAAFVLPKLRPEHNLLDCGCGPGTISCDFAQLLKTGHVTGIDQEASQIEISRKRASERSLSNISFEVASIYELPFEDATFDCVFSHALFEHISSTDRAAHEIQRVLKPGGFVGIRSPDWGGFLVGPNVPGLDEAINSYKQLQIKNGGDVFVGRKLPALLRDAGFIDIQFSAHFDCYQSASLIAEYLCLKLNDRDARAMRQWGSDLDAFFAQAWCAVIGTKRI